MARTIAGRLDLSGVLATQTPLHVGGHGDDVDTDLPLARNGAGQLYVPGTSLAGALRAWCEAAFGTDITQAVWGYQNKNNSNDGLASYVHVEDATLMNPNATTVEIRDGVGIDRAWGSAAEQMKYDRAVLPRGIQFQLEMLAEFTDDSRQQTVAMFTALSTALAAGEVRLGAAKTRGLGRLRLAGGAVREHTLNTREGMLAFLSNRAGITVTAPTVRLRPRPWLEALVHWHPRGPLMVKAGADGVGVDAVPLVSGVEGGLALVLPGSSVKGAVRNQAERIVRTLLSTPLSREPDPKRRFLQHMEEVPLIEALFGAAGKGQRLEASADDERLARRGLGALGVDDCYGQQRFTSAQWQAIVTAGAEASVGQAVSPLRESLDTAGLPHWTAAFHVAVDRWTGGAAESLLYNVLEPHAVSWEPLRLTLDFGRLLHDEQLPALTLLLLVLRDVAHGRVPLGFATHRGMGAVSIDHVVFAGRDLPEPCQRLSGLTLPRSDLVGLPQEFRNILNQSWQRWLDTRRSEVAS